MRGLLVFVFIIILALSFGSAWFFFGALDKDVKVAEQSIYNDRILNAIAGVKGDDAKSAFVVAELYSAAPIPLKNLKETRFWYEKASQGGWIEAQVKLGRMYELGQGGTADIRRAIKWYQLAVRSGQNKDAAFRLAEIYFKGKGVLQNQDKAFKLYRMAASSGHPVARYLMGNMYETGWGVEPDVVTAFAWYTLAAKQAEIVSQYNKNFKANDALARLSKSMSASLVLVAKRKALKLSTRK